MNPGIDETASPAVSGIVLVTTFHVNQDANALDSILRVLAENAGNALLSRIVILLEGDRADLGRRSTPESLARLARMEDTGRVRIESTNERPSYKQLFDLANRQDTACTIVANADIVIPHATAARVGEDRRERGNPFCALTRWNQTESGQFLQSGSAVPPWSEISFRDLPFHRRNLQSFDAYIFDLPLVVPAELDQIRIGTMGCDTAMVGILRAAGIAVSNPCLSYQTIHVDDRPRRPPGKSAEVETRQNVKTFRAFLLSRYSSEPAVQNSLEKLDRLDIGTAWLGGPAIRDPWRAVFRALGSVPWSRDVASPRFLARKITVERLDLEKARLDLSRLTEELAAENLFVQWELSGFDQDENVVNILARYPAYREIANQLGRYQWQSMIHADRAGGDVRSIYQHLMLVVKKLLINRTDDSR